MGMFLTTLSEPLWTTLAVVDFVGKTMDEVIDRFLRLDSAQTSNIVSMNALQRALLMEGETRFGQASQCTTCLNPTIRQWNVLYGRIAQSIMLGPTH